MLSLKRRQGQQLYRSKYALVDLPSEILDLILQYLYRSSGCHLSSILPISRTCRLLRSSMYHILFEKLTIKANEDIIEKRSWNMLQNLANRHHFMKHVRCLEIQTAIEQRPLPSEADIRSAKMGQGISRKKLLLCMSKMSGLRFLKLHYISDMIFEILERLRTTTSLQVSLDLSNSESCLEDDQIDRIQQIMSSAPGWTCCLSLPPKRLIQNFAGLANLTATTKIGAMDWCDNSPTFDHLAAGGNKLSHLTELHISSKILESQYLLLTSGIIPWRSLLRLHVEGDRQIQHLLGTTINKLTNLEDLRLHASTTDAFHEECIHPWARNPDEALPFTHLPSLRHLSLRGVCPHINIRFLTTPTLKSLSLTVPEYHARLRTFNEIRSLNEIKWLVTNLPHLEHLELHIGSLENLWHPTAIPGIEVQVEVYVALQYIAQIPNLKTLRLFPPYVPRNAGHAYLNARQPLSDEQAIRVFRYLHSLRPSLTTLSIAATFYALRGFSPMSWLVRNSGNGKTLMTTRQAGKDYELFQVWEGLRRSTWSNRRHLYQKPYLTELGGGSWAFPVEDPFV